MRGKYQGIDNLELDLPSQVEYNRKKNVTQDQQISNLTSQLQQIIEQTPSGFLPKVYYGLTRGAQTYRFIEDNVFNVVLPGEVGSAYELYSTVESDSNYIPAIAVQINENQIQVVIEGDYRVNTATFDAVNTTDGSTTQITLITPLNLQDASYLGQYNAQENPSKQITVLNNLETGAKNVVFASIDYNSDGRFNWAEIGGFSNGTDGKCIYSVSSINASSVFSVIKAGDSFVVADEFTYDGTTYNGIGDVYLVNTTSPFVATLNGNIRGAQGVQGVQGVPGQNGTNGYTPYIQSGNWYINSVDTGVRAYGHDGADGVNGQSFNIQSHFYSTPANYGQPGNDGPEGETLLQLPTLPQGDISGKGYVVYDPLTTPLYPFYDLYYANNGDLTWTVMHPFSGIKGQDGQDGYTPYIQNGHWYINGVDTGVNATGATGATGADGADGVPVMFVATDLSTSTDTLAISLIEPASARTTLGIGNLIISQNGYLAEITAKTTTTITTTFVKSLIGPQGATGATGATPNISVTATALSFGSSPTATRSGTNENPIISFGIPGVTASDVADVIYPVGSIYMSVNSTSPSVLFGGTWTQISQGRVLFGAGTLDGNTYTAGQTIAAGLPNITGEIGGATGWWNNSGYATGAFTKGDKNGEVGSSGNAIGKYRVYFNASLSNRIYGNSSTVQPPAYVVYMWERTA